MDSPRESVVKARVLARTAHAAASRIKAQMAQEHADAVRRGHHPGAPR